MAASPISAFLIGPIAGAVLADPLHGHAGRPGARWGWLLGDGAGRGIALVFTLVSLVGLAITLAALASRLPATVGRRRRRLAPPPSPLDGRPGTPDAPGGATP